LHELQDSFVNNVVLYPPGTFYLWTLRPQFSFKALAASPPHTTKPSLSRPSFLIAIATQQPTSMATHDHYRGQMLNNYTTPPRQQSPSFAYLPYSASPSDPPYQSSTSLPSYDSRVRPYRQDDSPYQSPYGRQTPSDERYEDNGIPLKPTSKTLQSEESFQMQDTNYPPSPESQKGSSLLPHPRPMKKKKDNGFFTGKIPWVVFTVSLVQISVFIGEIIKNCKRPPPGRCTNHSC